jgi:hypothetical protein
MRHVSLLGTILPLIAMTLTVGATPQYEFAFLSFPDGGVRWVDKSGARAETGNAVDLFAELSGEGRDLARSPQARVLVLNGLSRRGWELVKSADASEPAYLLRREVGAGGSTISASVAEPARLRPAAAGAPATADGTRLPITITGGHDTDPRDHGRPVALVAAALKVPDAVFRETFTHVRPAGPGRNGPTPDEARANKQALMDGLAKYGVTNDRLDEVSNFYRYAAFNGDKLWRNTPAEAYATVRDGVVTGVTITKGGAGYTTPPTLSIAGMEGAKLQATLEFGTDCAKNGSIKEITVVPAEATKPAR